MSGSDLERRVAKLEQTHEQLEDTISKLNTTVALLNQTVETMAKAEDQRQTLRDRGLLFVMGAFISAAVAWVIKGGLSQ